MNRSLKIALLVLCSALPTTGHATVADRFERVSPAEAGYSETGLAELEATLERRGSSAMLLLHGGRVFFEYGDIHQVTFIHSIRKALLSSLVGIHAARGELDLDATLEELGIDDAPQSLTAQEKRATLRQLMAGRSGIYLPAAAESAGMEASRPARGSHAPGSFHYYNNWDFNAVGAIFEQETGKGVFETFFSELAEPLGMLHYRGEEIALELPADVALGDADSIYQFERSRSRFPAYHFRLSAHDLALYGQLMLQRGQWQGEQLIPEAWIDQATQPVSIVDAEWDLAYGLMWQVLIPDEGTATAPSFYHTGTGVHMLGVYPALDLVMVHRVDTEQPYRFGGGDLIDIIRLMHGARVAGASGS